MKPKVYIFGCRFFVFMKKGEIETDTIAKLLIALALLLILLLIFYLFKGRMYEFFDQIKRVLRFGV